jgi:hypothetical protein
VGHSRDEYGRVGIPGRDKQGGGQGACAIKRLFISQIPSLWPEISHQAGRKRETALAEPEQDPGPVSPPDHAGGPDFRPLINKTNPYYFNLLNCTVIRP